MEYRAVPAPLQGLDLTMQSTGGLHHRLISLAPSAPRACRGALRWFTFHALEPLTIIGTRRMPITREIISQKR
jgi:hypothetical protein